MKLRTAAFLIATLAASPVLAAETRCGWLQNPTPGNWWLDDADGSWTIMSQGGGDGPQGMDLIPDISERDYVRTNGNYGYACACLSVETDDNEESITGNLVFPAAAAVQMRKRQHPVTAAIDASTDAAALCEEIEKHSHPRRHMAAMAEENRVNLFAV